MTTTMSTKALHAEAIRKLSNNAFADGTYNLRTMEAVEFNHGFQVTFCQIGDDYSEDDYDFISAMFSEVSEDGIVYGGQFDGSAEISFLFTDKLTAIKYAKMFNQISIWDWKNCEEIKTGGTGKRG